MIQPQSSAFPPSEPGARRVPSELLSYSGIIVMTLLFGVIVAVSIVGMQNIQSTGEEIVQDRIEKIALVQAMGVAARERTVLLQRMIMVDDPFERDQLALDYNIQGSRFANARMALLAKDLAERERDILDRQGRTSGVAVPIQNEVVDLIADDRLAEAKAVLTQKAMPLQDKVLAALSELMQFQTSAANESVIQTRRSFERGRVVTVVMTAIGAGVAIVLIWLVSKAARQRRDYYEQLQAATRAKSSFLAKMSHEIRTPLTAIIGFAELSLDGSHRPDERTDALRTIHRSGRHLLSIINDILDLSKIEADKFSVAPERASLFRILDEIGSLAQMQATAKGLQFDINYRLPLPRYIETDPLRLKQIIINLCGNAVKFTERGFVRINVAFDRLLDQLMIEVEDTGIGMNPEEIGRLFQEFHQADAGINRRFGGTGLGLALSQRLATLLGGNISVASSKGVGSRFSLVLRQREITHELVYSLREIEIESAEARAVVSHTDGQFAGSVLLVEDTPEIRNLVTMYLRRAGAQVHAVENGVQALAAIAAGSFDLVLMDIQMPVMDGIAAMTKLREAKYPVPVVALTANAMKDERELYQQAGFAEFLAKPVDRGLLNQVLGKHLKAAHAAEDAPIRCIVDADDPEMRSLVVAFVEKLPEYWNPIENAMKSRNWARVQDLAHKLKGLGGSMGYPVVSDIAASILFQLKAENHDEVVQHVKRLGDVVVRIQAGFKGAAPAQDDARQRSAV
jgi:signal transduction histidine kinase/ActR/RegA family two-component response regulator